LKSTMTKECLYCGAEFKPYRPSQMYCRNKCLKDAERDTEYFDGMRRTAIGFEERKCWICQRDKLKSFHVHHAVSRADDSKDPLLVVLCPGCHTVVTLISHRTMLTDPHKVADLLTLARFAAGLPDAKTIVKYEEAKDEQEDKA
jgi:5-methylcytosine-specific restriction endonuclease McrA